MRPDLALAERCRAGVPGAFDELYRTHAPRLFGLACRLVGRVEAEDLLQEMFLTAHRKLALYKGESALGTWLTCEARVVASRPFRTAWMTTCRRPVPGRSSA